LRWRRLLLAWRRCLLRMRLRLNLLLLLTLGSWCWLVLRWRRRLLRTGLRLNLLLALGRRSWLLTRRRRLLRMSLWLNLLLTLQRSRSWLVLNWGRCLLRASLRLNLLLARGRRRYRLISRRLVAIGLLRGARLWAYGWWVAMRLNILLSRSRLTSTVRLLLLHGVGWRGRWRGTRSRSGARGNYGGDGFALRDWLGCGDDGGLAVIDGGKLLTVLRGLFAMLNLGGHRRNALLARGG
jgi:hypothetical protein